MPDAIISNSVAGKDYHVSLGYPPAKFSVIENGIDTERYRFEAESGAAFRKEHGFSDSALLVGLVARIDPMKGHADFLEVAAALLESNDKFRFVCIGGGAPDLEKALREKAEALSLGDRLVWLPGGTDTVAVYNACDVMLSTSLYGEGFSNVVAEALACGTPCVVSDVGDSSRIVGELCPVDSSENLGSF